MLTSLALLLVVGLLMGWIFKQFHLPGLLGMLITGVLLGPYMLNLIDQSVLNISAEIRQIALIIILARAGLSLKLEDLKQVGRPGLLMCFIPACLEILGMILVGPYFLNITRLEAAIIGSVIAAVSPAVIVPRMINLLENGYGTNKKIPQLIMAGASIDDVFVIVVFTSLISLATGDKISWSTFMKVPLSIIFGVVVGAGAGFLLSVFFKRVQVRKTVQLVILLCLSFLLVSCESTVAKIIPFSGLLAVMAMGIVLLKYSPIAAVQISDQLSKLWIAAEVLLFALVGATINLAYVAKAGIVVVILVLIVSVFRMLGVVLCLINTSLDSKERIFCVIAYLPKATVQAAIGGIPLAMGLACGEIVLTVAVLSILITAPIGAIGMDLSYKKLLKKEKNCSILR